MSDTTPTRMLRRTLEEALGMREASSILFEALSLAGNRVPQNRHEVMEVVRGPLREVLVRRLDEDSAEDIVSAVEAQISPKLDELATLELPLEALVAQTRKDDVTATFVVEEKAVKVMIVANGPGFESRLAITLGENRAAPFTVSSHEALDRALRNGAPPIVVVDASDFPSIDPRRLITAATSMPATSACVLWGAELPYGRNLSRTIATTSRSWVELELREGIAPLLDLVRSRGRNKSE